MKRVKRKQKVKTFKLKDNSYLKLRLYPKIYTGQNCVWNFGAAVSKSLKQVNRFLARRTSKIRNKRTGRQGFITFSLSAKFIRHWLNQIPEGDFIFVQCDTEKQYRIYKEWIIKKEENIWFFNDSLLSFWSQSKGCTM